MGCKRFLVWLLVVLPCLGDLGLAQVHVRGYFRKDGTYVAPHYRSSPDGIFSNNWSTYGNVNPYTGAHGTKRFAPPDYGADVAVRGYHRANGTYVAPHFRSAPDGDPRNNWGTLGNVNPYTGQPGKLAVSGNQALGHDDAGEIFQRSFQQAHSQQLQQQELQRRSLALMLLAQPPSNRAPQPKNRALPRAAPQASAQPRPPTSTRAPQVFAPKDKSVPSQPPALHAESEEQGSTDKSTAPGRVRLGLQSGLRSRELLDVTITPSGPGQLRFEWTELGRNVAVVASEDRSPGEVVRGYRSGLFQRAKSEQR